MLDNYAEAGHRIKNHLIEHGAIRFSTKKLVADLGEYYFSLNCMYLFNGLVQMNKATAEYDFRANKSQLKFEKNSTNPIRIEVKTRHAQDNNPYLSGVKVEKFDLLVFVHLNEDYSCRYIGVMDKNEIKGQIDKKRNRLVFRKELIKLWETAPFEKIKRKRNNYV